MSKVLLSSDRDIKNRNPLLFISLTEPFYKGKGSEQFSLNGNIKINAGPQLLETKLKLIN